jgi:DNA replication regulator SLD3
MKRMIHSCNLSRQRWVNRWHLWLCHGANALQLLPESNSKNTHVLVPIGTLNRSQLRLSYLDFAPRQASLPSGRPFHAETAILNEHRPGEESKLLLARQAPNGGLYIIEEAGEGAFVACRLRGWVKDDFFGVDVTSDAGRDLLEKLCGDENQSMALDDYPTPKGVLSGACKTAIPSPKRPKNRKGVLARMSIMPKIELGKPSTVLQEREPELVRHPAANQYPAGKNLSVDAVSSSFPAENGSKSDIREAQDQIADTHETERSGTGPEPSRSANDAIASQHQVLLQTLYTSKSNLAYFTKSTLARTRATVRSFSTTSHSELAHFYRSRLITSKKMDLKYRDTIPKIIENAVMQLDPGEGDADLLAKCTKKTSGRKKLGKDGLFAGEEAFVRTWWLSRDSGKNEMSNLHSRGQQMQTLLTDLRNRETQLQIILVLEIMTLESRQEAEPQRTLPPAALKQEPDQDESKSILAATPLKINKKRNLKPDLDILVDRLCIYQSVSVVDLATTDEAKGRGSDTGNEAGDKLRDFCCNVILPYYRHKAPDLVKEISRKLGGPDLSPKRPIISSRNRSISRVKPGAALDPRRHSIPQRTLERVLSEEQSSRQPSPPVLMRSVTAPLGGGCSRASVETAQRPSSRGSLQKSRSFTNREVDLVASNKAHTAKRKKLANLAKQKQELDAAIHALRKPNRGLAGMEIMTEAEQRRAEQDPLKRSTLGRSSSSQTLDLQIAATPKKTANQENSRRKGLNSNWDPTTQPADQSSSLNPEETAIPSSAIRPVPHNHATHPSAAVFETPSRGPHKTSNPLHLLLPAIPQQQHPDPYSHPHFHSSNQHPLLPPPTIVESTPIRMTKSNRPVLFTSLSHEDVTVHTVFRDAPLVERGPGVRRGGGGGFGSSKEASIYQSLGWDDDDDDDVDELL